MSSRIYLSAPDVGTLEEEAVVRAMRGGWIAPLGPEVDSFEEDVADRVGRKHAIALSSGTAALHLGLLSLDVQPGDVVVTSTMTFAATTNAIMYTGATPYFIDCLPGTGNMDPELLRAGLTHLQEIGTKVAAILPVDLLGKAIDYTSILQIAEEFGIPVLADAAESMGATHRGTPAGAFGEIAIFSFNGNKIMTTSGGGMLLTDNDDVMKNVRYLSTQARQPVTHYEHHHIGYNYRLSNVLAALGRAQLARLDDMIAKRRVLRDQYKQLFAGVEGVSVFGDDGDLEDNVWLTAIEIDSDVTGWTRQELSATLTEANIESRPLWKPMHLQPVFAQYGGQINGASEKLFQSSLTLPSGSAIHEDDHERVLETISGFVAR